MRATESVIFAAVDVTTAGFTLQGGKYQLIIGSAVFGGGNVGVQQRVTTSAFDGWVSVHTVLTAVGVVVVDIPPGQFRLNLVTATGVNGFLSRIPME